MDKEKIKSEIYKLDRYPKAISNSPIALRPQVADMVPLKEVIKIIDEITEQGKTSQENPMGPEEQAEEKIMMRAKLVEREEKRKSESLKRNWEILKVRVQMIRDVIGDLEEENVK